MESESPPVTPRIPRSDILQYRLLLSFWASILVIGAAILLRKLRGSSFRKHALLLVGPSSGGKTAIFSTIVYGQTLPSHTSLQTNSSIVTLPSLKELRVVDVPGHPRVRDQFKEYINEAKVIAFVVDCSTVSRNGSAVAEHLHHVLHELTSLPPSQLLPSLLILAHKADTLKGTSASSGSPTAVAINRVMTILERELEKRRQSQSGAVGVEGLGEEGDRTELSGLECSGPSGGAFKFSEWEGGDVVFMGTSVRVGEKQNFDALKKNNGLDPLVDYLGENI